MRWVSSPTSTSCFRSPLPSSSWASRASSGGGLRRPDHLDDRVDDTVGGSSVHLSHDLTGDAPTLGRKLVRLIERPADPGDDLPEARRADEGVRRDDLLVVLAGHVEGSVLLALRRALVVEDANGGTVVGERVEQDRPCVADDAIDVLEER